MPSIGFRATVLTVLLLFVNTTLLAALSIQHHGDTQLIRHATDALFTQIGERVRDDIQTRAARARTGAEALAMLGLAQSPVTEARVDAPLFEHLRVFTWLNPSLYSAYVGRDDGTFLQVIAVRDQPSAFAALKPPATTDEARRAIVATPTGRRETWWFLDRDGRVLESRTDDAPAYDPRHRPWFAMAAGDDITHLSPPYVFQSTAKPGVTLSHRLRDGGGVVGMDISFDGLNDLATAQTVSAHGAVIITDSQDRVLGAPAALRATLTPLARLADSPHPLAQAAIRADGEGLASVEGTDDQAYLVAASTWRHQDGQLRVRVVAPTADFAAELNRIYLYLLVVFVVVQVVSVPVGLWLAGMLSRTVRDLAADAERINEMDFTGEIPPPPPIRELRSLTRAFTAMKCQVMERTKKLNNSQATLIRLLNFGISLGVERNPHKLTEVALGEAIRLANAEGGVVFTRIDDNRLQVALIHDTSLGLQVGGTDDVDADLPELPIRDPATDAPLRDNVVADAFHGGAPIFIPDIRAWTKHDLSAVLAFDAATEHHTQSLLAIPLRLPDGTVVGVLQLTNLRDESGKPAALGGTQAMFVSALVSQVAVALHNRQLVKEQQGLVDGMVSILAAAIDAKSPYTGEHAGRLAELAVMLADEAGASTDPAFADFPTPDEEQRHELHVAALLHDCGKVTTPEYVIDKATKLETIHNRIHEVRTRFEVLLRDARILQLEAVAAGADPVQAETDHRRRAQRLTDDFAFIARCNLAPVGSEDAARIKAIGAQVWLRHFDDRLGLAHGELALLQDVAVAALPAQETLLTDRPEHRVPWIGNEAFRDPSWGFNMTIPEVMYDRGEIHNLCIAGGTLTAEERFKINEHVIQSIIMLEKLAFPKNLRHVPAIACAHHEAMNGRGYPRGLGRADMPLPARVMAIADVFEALTAADRPYKKAKTLSESLEILAGFRDRGHIDPDLFALFLKTGVYRRYAERFLPAAQIDDVDIAPLLQAPPPPAASQKR